MLLAAEGNGVAAAGSPLPPQPVASVRTVTTPFGVEAIVDPYRWMEDMEAPELVDWARAQDAHTRAALAARTRRAELLARIEQLAAGGDELGAIRALRGSLLYAKRPAAAMTYQLFVRDARGVERLLLDPASVGAASSIDFFEPSPDGRLVALGLSQRGSEDSRLRVLDVASGRLLGEDIAGARNAMPQWRPDSRSFFYMRRPPPAPGAPAAARGQKARSYLHVVGADAAADLAVFGYQVSPDIAVGINDSTWVRVFGDSPYALAVARRGAQTGRTIYFAPLASVGANTPWKKVTDVEDGVDDYLVHGRDLYLLTHKNAPRFKVIRVSLDAPDLARATTVLPPGSAVAVAFMVGSDALYVRRIEAGIGHIVRVPFDGGAPATLALPFEGTVAGLWAEPTEPGMVCQLESWSRPPVAYAYEPKGNRFVELPLAAPPTAAPALPPLEAREVMVASADGTRVPLSIVYPRGLDLSRPHPTLLTAYGSYGISLSPNYEPRRTAWFERGGIYAVAHVRGGGELGEEWHVAGMKATKQHSVDDLVACARYLLAQGYATTRSLGAIGRSAGGITVGGALTQHPELFGAVVIEVGIVDALRFEHNSAVGAANAHEFGSWDNPDERAPLYAMSPYYHVKAARYPAVLLTGGAHDVRVPLWQPAKLAARLQAASTSGKPILLRVDYEGGHGYSNEAGYNTEAADRYAFLLWQLGGGGAPGKHESAR